MITYNLRILWKDDLYVKHQRLVSFILSIFVFTKKNGNIILIDYYSTQTTNEWF